MNAPKELLDQLLDGEKAYPIYRINTKWSQDITEKDCYLSPAWVEGLPVGRMWNSTSCYRMPKEASDDDKVKFTRETMLEWWPKYQVEHEGLNLTALEITVTFLRWETWCLGWFNHWTWDPGLSNANVLASFGRFVERTEQLNRQEGEVRNGYWQEPYCLMGAEDRLRWCGQRYPSGETTEPPCRCEHCKKRGVVTIGH